MPYSLEKFNEIINSTRLGESTREALKAHLVHGLTNTEASESCQIFSSQLTRGLKTFKEKELELEKSSLVQTMDKETQAFYFEQDLIKTSAIKAAREKVGKNVPFEDAEQGMTYSGNIIDISKHFVIQYCDPKANPKCIIHDLGKLSVMPKLDTLVSIKYPLDKYFGSVDILNLKTKSMGR